MTRDAQPGPFLRRRSPWRLAGGHVLLSAVFVGVLAAAPPGGGFVRHLPEGVPDLARFSKASGSAEMENGSTLEYELYYQAHRGNYEIIRYRLSGWDGGGSGAPYSTNERLQWQAQVKELRRYVCEPAATGCRWRELPKDGDEYRRELEVVMWVLSLHRRLLYEREAASPR